MNVFLKWCMCTGFGSCALIGAPETTAQGRVVAPVVISSNQLAAEKVRYSGALAAAYRINDRDGEHILVLGRQTGPSLTNPRSGREERIDLHAEFYQRIAVGEWKKAWSISDSSDCPGLDVDGDFFVKQITFTDLNEDGKVEITVPYRLFCGGAIEPSTIKVILREGNTKLAIRGESTVQVQHPGVDSFGGEHKHDAALLLPGKAAYKQHLDAVWRRVSIEKR